MKKKYSGFLKSTIAMIITLCAITLPLQTYKYYDLQKSSNTLLELLFIVEAISQNPNDDQLNALDDEKFRYYLHLISILKKSAGKNQPSKIHLDMVKEQIVVIHTQQQKKLSENQSILGWLSFTLIIALGFILNWYLKIKSKRKKEIELSEVVNSLSRADEGEVSLAEDTLRIFSERLNSTLSFYWEWEGKLLKNRAMYSHNNKEFASHMSREITIGTDCIGECWLEKKSKWNQSKIKADHYVLCLPVLASANNLMGVLEFHLPSIDNIDIEQLDQIGLRLGEALSKYNTTVELKQANKLLIGQKQALDSAAIVAETDLKGKITYVNDKFIEISGYSEKELIGQDHRILNSGYHDKAFFVQLWKTINKGHVWTQEVKNRKKNGDYYWVDTTIYPAKDQNGSLSKFIAIRFDITSRKEAEAEIIKARDESQKAMEIKSHFLATVSHQIRTPLKDIIGLSDSLLSENIPQETQRSITTIKQCGETLYSIINDFLDFSKIEDNQLTIEQTNTNLRSILSTISDMFQEQISQKGIQLNYHIEKRVPESILTDPTRLQQVIVNLVSNAIKFTDEGEVLVSVSSKPLAESDKHQIINIKIKDTGIGIEPHKMSRLFDSLQQTDKSTTRKFVGTGIGLSISKKLVEMMDGDISVTSKPGVGSTFEFTIVAHVTHTSIIDTNSSKLSYDISNNLRVLVVEDNRINIKLMKSYLGRISISPKIAVNGVEACKLCSESVFDLILMDLNMPILDGWSATTEIRKSKLNRCSTILALTASTLDDIKDQCMAVGFNEITLKPIRKKSLYSTLERIKVNPADLPTFDEQRLADNFPTKFDLTILKDIAQDFSSRYQHHTNNIRHGVRKKNIDQLKKSVNQLKAMVRKLHFPKCDYILQFLEEINLESQLIPAIDTWLLELEQELENANKILDNYIENADKSQIA